MGNSYFNFIKTTKIILEGITSISNKFNTTVFKLLQNGFGKNKNFNLPKRFSVQCMTKIYMDMTE